MSLVIVKGSRAQSAGTAGKLEPGTWFLDTEGELSTVFIDERTYEKRVVSVGPSFRPFIANCPARDIRIRAVIPVGSVLQVSQADIKGGQENGQ